jgi:hypothetical protein
VSGQFHATATLLWGKCPAGIHWRLGEPQSRSGQNSGPKRDEATGEWRKLHNEELHDLYSSPSIIRIIMSRRMRRAGHVTRMGEKGNAYRLL